MHMGSSGIRDQTASPAFAAGFFITELSGKPQHVKFLLSRGHILGLNVLNPDQIEEIKAIGIILFGGD